MEDFPANLTREQLEAAELYIQREKTRLKLKDALIKEDFLEWIRVAFSGLLDEAENIWRWIRRQLGLTND